MSLVILMDLVFNITDVNSANSSVGALGFDAVDGLNYISITAGGLTCGDNNVPSNPINSILNANSLTFNDGNSGDSLTIDINKISHSISTSVFTIESSNTSLEFKPNDTTGDLIFTGTNIQSSTSGSNSGQHLRIKLNGVYYKIKLEDDV